METSTLSRGQDGYPVGLLDLEVPPDLFVRGELRQEPGVAVVGTRKCTGYGVSLATGFGSALARAGWTTVSGLARGIDTASHRGCLGSEGHGVAVLGSGIDVVYPRENRDLYNSLLKSGGAIVSEFEPGTPPDRWRFPARNRIIAAMSAAVVVVEAADQGGALITARLAAEIGRPVFVVPGDVDRPASVGCNRLIKDGAHPVLGIADLIAELSLVLGPPRIGGSRAVEASIPLGGIHIEELADHWSITTSQALVRLAEMEIAGMIRRIGGAVFPA